MSPTPRVPEWELSGVPSRQSRGPSMPTGVPALRGGAAEGEGPVALGGARVLGVLEPEVVLGVPVKAP